MGLMYPIMYRLDQMVIDATIVSARERAINTMIESESLAALRNRAKIISGTGSMTKRIAASAASVRGTEGAI